MKKKCKVFGNFLTFKWQFSGGSDPRSGRKVWKMIPGGSRKGPRNIVIYKILLYLCYSRKGVGKMGRVKKKVLGGPVKIFYTWRELVFFKIRFQYMLGRRGML